MVCLQPWRPCPVFGPVAIRVSFAQKECILYIYINRIQNAAFFFEGFSPNIVGFPAKYCGLTLACRFLPNDPDSVIYTWSLWWHCFAAVVFDNDQFWLMVLFSVPIFWQDSHMGFVVAANMLHVLLSGF